MSNKLTAFRRWTFRIIMALMIVWGTFAAVVAFAVRYEFGPFALPNEDIGLLDDQSNRGPIERPRLLPGDWGHLMPPAEISKRFESVLASRDGTTARDEPDLTKINLVLDWRPSDSTAIWTGTYIVGCDCPYTSSEDAPKIVALINPLSGRVIDLTAYGVALLPTISEPTTASPGKEARQ